MFNLSCVPSVVSSCISRAGDADTMGGPHHGHRALGMWLRRGVPDYREKPDEETGRLILLDGKVLLLTCFLPVFEKVFSESLVGLQHVRRVFCRECISCHGDTFLRLPLGRPFVEVHRWSRVPGAGSPPCAQSLLQCKQTCFRSFTVTVHRISCRNRVWVEHNEDKAAPDIPECPHDGCNPLLST